jgi:hypothetical protein
MKSALEEKLEQLKSGAGQETAAVVAQNSIAAVAQNYDKLNFVTPIEVVDLPSEGRFYPENHPLHNQKTIEIRQMTAKDEDILTNRSFIKKGIVIDKFIESIIVNKSIPVHTLLVGDKNAIVIAARITGYGQSYDVSVLCSECGTKNNRRVDLNDAVVNKGITALEGSEDSAILPNGNILLKLPKTAWIVECKILNGEDEIALLKMAEEKKRNSTIEDITGTQQLQIIVKSINGVADKDIVEKGIGAMPAADAKHLRKKYQELIPDIKIKHKFACELCLTVQDVEVPFTQEFFWPK